MQCFRTGWRATRRDEPPFSHLFTGVFYISGQMSLFTRVERPLLSKKEKDHVTEKARENPSSFRIPATRPRFSHSTRFFDLINYMFLIFFSRINLPNNVTIFVFVSNIKILLLILFHELKYNGFKSMNAFKN